jgi:hypothetical protein
VRRDYSRPVVDPVEIHLSPPHAILIYGPKLISVPVLRIARISNAIVDERSPPHEGVDGAEMLGVGVDSSAAVGGCDFLGGGDCAWRLGDGVWNVMQGKYWRPRSVGDVGASAVMLPTSAVASPPSTSMIVLGAWA